MRVLPLHAEIIKYLNEHKLRAKFDKQIRLLRSDIRHPGLGVELLEPRHLRIFSFRIDRKYRTIFIFRNQETIEILDVNNHYR